MVTRQLPSMSTVAVKSARVAALLDPATAEAGTRKEAADRTSTSTSILRRRFNGNASSHFVENPNPLDALRIK